MLEKNSKRISTGITGLDELLYGGLIPNSAYLVRGGPGTGKTTLALHFLTTDNDPNSKNLYITFSEAAERIKRNANLLGFNLENVLFLDITPPTDSFVKAQTYDIFSSAEVERDPTTKKIVEQVETFKPHRIVLDPMTQLRYLSNDDFQFRKQTLSLLRFLIDSGATVILVSESCESIQDEELQFTVDGIINLTSTPDGRQINVSKYRGSDFRNGQHTLRLTSSGMEVYPKLLPEIYRKKVFTRECIASGIPELDEMLCGGLERGTVTIMTGPTGVGKTTLGLQFMKEAAGRGERSVVYLFEEWQETLLQRCEAINIPARTMVQRGTLNIVQSEPLRYTPDEFSLLVRDEVEHYEARIVMIDSVAGYRLSMRRTGDLVSHLHSLCKYLQNMGVTVIMINEVENVIGTFVATEVGISYLADNVIFLRYIERVGELRKTIGVLKKRLSNFEKTLRELDITRYGIKVGKPLTNLRNILSGTPELLDSETLKRERDQL